MEKVPSGLTKKQWDKIRQHSQRLQNERVETGDDKPFNTDLYNQVLEANNEADSGTLIGGTK